MVDALKAAALAYHRRAPAGKLSIQATKPLGTQRDLALAYSPGVAAACEAILDNPEEAANLTSRGNLVGVVSNGTAVLGLGAIGPLASKPVMEGKAVLFKKFAGIDVFDIEVDANDPERFCDVVAALEPTFGGINLEDIKAPECFIIEQELRHRMSIPVFHDDQHGTAIIVAAAILNGLRLVGKDPGQVKLVASGAGAAAIACLNLLVKLGIKKENIWVTDIAGVVFEGRQQEMDEWKSAYAQPTNKRTLAEVIPNTDVFLGLSAKGVLKAEMVEEMAADPLILALANPNPEIDPATVHQVRSDAMVATGRSDYPNQVNNVLCFPFIFRGALDVGATEINEEMKLAAVRAIADLAMAEQSEDVQAAYGGEQLSFGQNYIIPKPFDPRLILKIAPAVAKAACETGVARRPIEDWEAYEARLNSFVFRSGLIMKPVFERAREVPKRVIFAEGEDERVLRAAQAAIDEGVAKPILIGRPRVVESRLTRLGLRIRAGEDFELINPEHDDRYRDYWETYHNLMGRRGVTPDAARLAIRSDPTAIAAIAVRRGDADAMICGLNGAYAQQLNLIDAVIGKAPGTQQLAAMSGLIMPSGAYFICDTYVNNDPSSDDIVRMTLLAASELARFGMTPKVALVSHSNFGGRDSESASKMQKAMTVLKEMKLDFEVEGEMHADAAIDEEIRKRILPSAKLEGAANLLIMPTLDAANIAFNFAKRAADGLHIGPILLGVAQPAHVLTPSATARTVLNMTAIASVEAQTRDQ
jgi:malate dehydrogenase (oxaloacetate-decarboxylating)(NADP+)